MLYELPSLKHIDAKSIGEAVACLHDYGEKAKVIAGGTDLLGLMKDRIEGPRITIPEVLINIKPVPEMSRIQYDEENGLRIGAAVTLKRVETHDVIKKDFHIFSQTVRQVATTQIRNMGTIGGNICQRPRCIYFRHPDFLCYRKGGTGCQAIAGEHRYYHAIMKYGKCVMAHPSDMAPALVALKAKAVIANPAGERQMPLEDFFLGPNDFTETVLKSDDLLVGVQVPNQGGKTYQVFLKDRIRHSSDFALSSVSAVAHIPDETCEGMRIVLGGVAPFPYIASGVADIIEGKRLTQGLISKAAEASVEEARPLRMNGYKVELTKTLVRRALTSILQKSRK